MSQMVLLLNIASVVLVLAALVYVSWPLIFGRLRPSSETLDADQLSQRRQRLATDRDLYFGQIRELKYDHNSGKISDEEFERSKGQLITRLVPLVRESMRMDREETLIETRIEDRVLSRRGKSVSKSRESSVRQKESEEVQEEQQSSVVTCQGCGTENPRGNRFCGQCGKSL